MRVREVGNQLPLQPILPGPHTRSILYGMDTEAYERSIIAGDTDLEHEHGAYYFTANE